MKNSENLMKLAEGLSDSAIHTAFLLAAQWPHGTHMGDSELTFQTAEKKPVIRLWKFKKEGLTVGKDAHIASHVKDKLLSDYHGKSEANGSIGLSFDDLAPADIEPLVELLLSSERTA